MPDVLIIGDTLMEDGCDVLTRFPYDLEATTA